MEPSVAIINPKLRCVDQIIKGGGAHNKKTQNFRTMSALHSVLHTALHSVLCTLLRVLLEALHISKLNVTD